MIIDDPVKELKLELARCTPYLPMLSFDLHSVCTDAVNPNFSDIRIPINIYFVEIETLACITKHDAGADIYIHVMLNDQSTPIQVCKHIVTHELIHLVVPHEMINGKDVAHTPTFWKHEIQMVPERSISAGWLWRNFCKCLRRDKQDEGIYVKRNWKSLANRPRYSWKYSRKSLTSFESNEVTL